MGALVVHHAWISPVILASRWGNNGCYGCGMWDSGRGYCHQSDISQRNLPEYSPSSASPWATKQSQRARRCKMSHAFSPLLSVVIPTHMRPQYLQRAIESALQSVANGDVEVIVVPNGPDKSWISVAEKAHTDRRIKWRPIHMGHANVARNHGMKSARGKYVRFLDDDDYLLPAAAKQVALLESIGAEICSGRIENVDEDGAVHDLLTFPDTDDFACAAVSFSGFALPTGHVFLRSCLDSSHWDVTLNRRQDYAWMLDLVAIREWKWVHLDEPVGVWFQHRGTRISHEKFMQEREQPVVNKLFALHERLDSEKRLDGPRGRAIAAALWHHAHLGFPYHPRYWTGVARRVQSISPDSRPPDAIFETGLLHWIDPVAGEWALFPLRKAIKAAKSLIAGKRNTTHRRRL